MGIEYDNTAMNKSFEIVEKLGKNINTIDSQNTNDIQNSCKLYHSFNLILKDHIENVLREDVLYLNWKGQNQLIDIIGRNFIQ